MKVLAEFIMRGRCYAVIVASVLAMISLAITPLIVVSSGTIGLVTLRRGASEGTVVLAGAGLLTLGFGMLLNADPWLIPLYVALIWLPVWLIALVLREGKHISLAVEVAVMLSVVGVLVFYLFNTDAAAFWKQWLPQIMPKNIPADMAKQIVDFLALHMTGAAALMVVMIALLGLFMGRWWQAQLYNPDGFRKEFLGIHAQVRTAILLLIVVLVTIAKFGKISEISLNTLIPLVMLYVVVGISVLHSVLAKTNMAKVAVPMFYTMFALSMIMNRTMLPIVALVGLADTWLDVRKINLKKT
jgi:hypothetical protein